MSKSMKVSNPPIHKQYPRLFCSETLTDKEIKRITSIIERARARAETNQMFMALAEITI